MSGPDREPGSRGRRFPGRRPGVPFARALPSALAATLVAALAMVPLAGNAVADPGAGPSERQDDRSAGRAAQAGGASAVEAGGQPYAPHWFPADIVDWSPRDDPDAPFNRSRTPLADRVQDERTRANPDAAARRVMALSVFGNTSGNPSQGSEEFDSYLSEFWPYLDTLVFWGGSAGEGLILAPNPTVTDAAHRNGVPVLGTVFLPPEAYGGDLQHTRDLLRRDADGNFPVAEKLIEAARYYGFDGWFVNAETEGADAELAGEMRDFLRALRAEAAESSGRTERTDDLRVLWYDSMVESGEIAWQNALNERNDDFFAASDLMFLNYWWDDQLLRDSAAHAVGLDRDPSDLHAGIDVGAEQFDIQQQLDTLYPSGGDDPGLSLGLYRPDFTFTGTDDPGTYAARESRFWVGADGDPATSRPDANGFRGVSSVVAEHTPVTETPFATSFGTGRGTGWFHDGQRWQTGDWYNLSAQDVLPTWRFTVRGPGAEDVSVGYDHERAWRGGSSLRLDGRLTDEVRLPLFATRLDVRADTEVSLTARSDSPGVGQDLLLWFAGSSDPEVVPLRGSHRERWTTREVSLSAYEGRTLTRIGIRTTPPAGTAVDLNLRLGGLSITDGEVEPPGTPTEVRVEPGPNGEDSDARVFWSPPREDDTAAADRFQVEAVAADGSRTWLGTTTAHAFYARTIPADAERIEVVALNGAGVRGAPGSADLP